MNDNNLIYLAERLQRGKWLIHKPAYEALAKRVDAFLSGTPGFIARLTSAASMLLNIKPSNLAESDSTFTPDETEQQDNGNGYTAVVQVNGVLIKGVSELDEECFGLCNTDRISQALDEAIADDSVKDIVLAFNSPGGETLGIEVLARKINQLSQVKPIYGWTDSQSASAAYWLMSQCNVIALTPDSQVGSVGVYCMLQDYSKALEKDGITINAIFAGKYKMLGHGFKPLADEERNILQADIDNTYNKFKSAITSKRTINDDDLQGLMYEGQTAIDKGYADLISDTLTEYLNNNKDMKNYTKIVKQEQPEKVASTPVYGDKYVYGEPATKAESPEQVYAVLDGKTFVVAPLVPLKAEEPAKEEEPKAEDEEQTNEEMKSAKIGEDNTIACPHCQAKFSVDMDEDKKSESDEGTTEPDDKAEDKPEEDEPREATAITVEPVGEVLPKTMGSLFGIPQAEKNKLNVLFETALNERMGTIPASRSTKAKGPMASMMDNALAERAGKE